MSPTLPTPDEGDPATMASPFDALHEQNMAALGKANNRLAATADAAHENFVTVQKIVDYSYLQERNMVSLPEALGAREVGSKSVPAGPTVPAG